MPELKVAMSPRLEELVRQRGKTLSVGRFLVVVG